MGDTLGSGGLRRPREVRSWLLGFKAALDFSGGAEWTLLLVTQIRKARLAAAVDLKLTPT